MYSIQIICHVQRIAILYLSLPLQCCTIIHLATKTKKYAQQVNNSKPMEAVTSSTTWSIPTTISIITWLATLTYFAFEYSHTLACIGIISYGPLHFPIYFGKPLAPVWPPWPGSPMATSSDHGGSPLQLIPVFDEANYASCYGSIQFYILLVKIALGRWLVYHLYPFIIICLLKGFVHTPLLTNQPMGKGHLWIYWAL